MYFATFLLKNLVRRKARSLLTILGIAYGATMPSDLDRAGEVLRRALELVPVDLDPSFNAVFRSVLGTNEFLRGHVPEALALFEAARDDAEHAGDRFVEGLTLTNIGWSRLALGEAHPEYFIRHLEITLSFGSEDGVGSAASSARVNPRSPARNLPRSLHQKVSATASRSARSPSVAAAWSSASPRKPRTACARAACTSC